MGKGFYMNNAKKQASEAQIKAASATPGNIASLRIATNYL